MVTDNNEIISFELEAGFVWEISFLPNPDMKWLETTDEHIKGRTKMESGILTKTVSNTSQDVLSYMRGNQEEFDE